jgi:hypothetical protein
MLTERTTAADSAVRQRDHVGLITQFSRERDHRLGVEVAGAAGRQSVDKIETGSSRNFFMGAAKRFEGGRIT